MDQKQTFERMEKHLYRRQYQTAGGDWSTIFYARFTDWKRKRRVFSLGADLRTAREQLKVLEADNVKKKDFDQEKIDLEKAKTEGMTLETWLGRYLDLVKSKRSWSRDKQHCKHLTRLLGSLPLSQITRPRIMEYKNARLTECIIRHGKPVDGKTVKISTVNREIRCLLHALSLGADDDLIENVPRVRLDSERHLARERVLSEQEYRSLLAASPRWLQRACAGAYEAALSRGDLLKLTRDNVKDGLIKVRGGRGKTGVKQVVAISPALSDILAELNTDFRKLPNTENRVFTKDGRPISVELLRKAFEKAKRDAGIGDFTFHDFRHCAVSRWATMGLPVEVAMVASGHKLPGMHGRYTNLQDRDIVAAFEKMATGWQHGNSGDSQQAAKSLN